MNIEESILNKIASTDEGAASIVAACDELLSSGTLSESDRRQAAFTKLDAEHAIWMRDFAAYMDSDERKDLWEKHAAITAGAA